MGRGDFIGLGYGGQVLEDGGAWAGGRQLLRVRRKSCWLVRVHPWFITFDYKAIIPASFKPLLYIVL